jgi:hypothetical protein
LANILSGLRRSIESLAEFRLLTDVEAHRLIDDLSVTKVIDEPVVWEVTRTRNQRPAEVRMKVTVENSLSERLVLDGRITLEFPWRSHWVLTWGSKSHHERPETIRRLDLRDKHRNPDGQAWGRETHKHLWSVEHGNSVAYTPIDIPHDPAVPPVRPDDYRAIFEAFAHEVNIDFGSEYIWQDPPLDTPETMVDPTIWEVP